MLWFEFVANHINERSTQTGGTVLKLEEAFKLEQKGKMSYKYKNKLCSLECLDRGRIPPCYFEGALSVSVYLFYGKMDGWTNCNILLLPGIFLSPETECVS